MPNPIETLGKKFIFDFERKRGKNPKNESGKGYDIISSGRFIEIKARQRDYPVSAFFFLSKEQYKMLKSRKKKSYIYVIYNLKKNHPKLKIISKSDVFEVKEEPNYRLKFNKENWSKIKSISL